MLKVMLVTWMLINFAFWLWWFQKNHIINIHFMAINTIALFYLYLFPAYLFFFALRMKKPNPELKLPHKLKVAMVVTKAPSEPFDVVKKTLAGMLRQHYPHDTWLADEKPESEVISWCLKKGVKISTRNGIEEYNRNTWPRRKRCKEGNLAYFYDKCGYANYDIICQMDADHIPQKDYLESMLRPFCDERVGYVTAPSICSNNAAGSWTARARLYSEGPLQGIQQAGHTNGFAPLCFGSHYAVRTQALKEIGGLGPELAEDHSTTMIMNAHGWRGVHAIEAMAYGNGPDNFSDAMTQEFQWSRSLTNILLMWTPKYIGRLPLHLKFQFLFSQLWYTFFSFSMLLGFSIPVFAVLNKTPLVKIPFPVFFIFNLANILATLMVIRYLKKLKLFRPIDAPIVSWEIAVFQIARWPWTLAGVLSSFYDFLRKKQFSFKVTPKDLNGFQPLPIKIISPYIGIVGFLCCFGLFADPYYEVRGYFYFLITSALMHFISLCVIIFLHAYENTEKNR